MSASTLRAMAADTTRLCHSHLQVSRFTSVIAFADSCIDTFTLDISELLYHTLSCMQALTLTTLSWMGAALHFLHQGQGLPSDWLFVTSRWLYRKVQPDVHQSKQCWAGGQTHVYL